MMKKIFAGLLSFTILLSSCFHGGGKKNVDKKNLGFHEYGTQEFSIQIPDDWEMLTPLQFSGSMPKNTLVAFRSKMRNPQFTANIVMLQNDLSGEISSLDYAKALLKKMKDELSSIREILVEEKKLKISGKEETTIFVFIEGRDTPEAEKKRFIQISGVKGKKAFVVLGSFLHQEKEGIAKKIETTVRSFEIK